MIDLKALATEYFETFSRKDLDGLAAMFTGDVTLRDWEISAAGIDEVVAANKKIFDSVEYIHVSPLNLYRDANTIAADLSIVVSGAIHLYVVDIITFNDTGKIVSIKAYKG
jgi:predicted metal-dependent enzyme (double-stranded beta helix superfamily)